MKSNFLIILCTLIVFILLCALGFWQLHRLHWKNDLQNQLDLRLSAPAIDLDIFAASINQINLKEKEFTKVEFEGEFIHRAEKHFYALKDGRPGWRIMTPVQMRNRILIIDRGFVARELKNLAQRDENLPQGLQRMRGTIRAGAYQKAIFELDNDLSRNEWYWKDLAAMLEGLDNAETAYYVELIEEKNANRAPPYGGLSVTRLRNKHLEYAVTWFGLAITLLVMSSAFIYANRDRPGR